MAGKRRQVTQGQIDMTIRFVDALVNHYGATKVEPGVYTNPFALNGGASYFTVGKGYVKFGDKKGGMSLSVLTIEDIANRTKKLPPTKIEDHSHEQVARPVAC